MIATQRGGILNFVFRDHLGSTRVVASADGLSGVGYSYDALGNIIGTQRFGSAIDLAYRYTGQEFDRETGLHNFRARLYDSDLFRFYATDPAGEQHSPYAFVGNSPLMFTDPTGGTAELIVWATAPTNPITAALATIFTIVNMAFAAAPMFQATPMIQPPQSYPSADYYRTSKEFQGNEPVYQADEITVRADRIFAETKAVSLQEAFAGLKGMATGIDGFYPRSMQQLSDMPYEDYDREMNQRNELLYTGTELATMGIGAGTAIGRGLASASTRGSWLFFHEGVAGGHTISKHVGKTIPDLIKRKIRIASSFKDLSQAESAISEVIKQNRSQIKYWMKNAKIGEMKDFISLQKFQNPTGYSYVKKSKTIVDQFDASVIVKKIGKKKYNIHTAFPGRSTP